MRRLQCGAVSILFIALSISMGFAQSGIITTYVGPLLPTNGESAVNVSIDTEFVVPDGVGGFYVVSQRQNRVYRVGADGKINVAAGNGNIGFSGDGRAAASAQLSAPWGAAVDKDGNLYIADNFNRRIRKVTTDGIIHTVAGNGMNAYAGDGGPATAASFITPMAVAVDSGGNIFIADRNDARIRKVTPDGVIRTIAGNGSSGYSGDGGSATAASIYTPHGLAVDSAGNLYIAENMGSRIRKVTPAGVISTIAGTGNPSADTGDGGQATAAQIGYPTSVAVDSTGNIYIADYGYNKIRKVTTDGIITTVAGIGTSGYSGDGGPAAVAMIGHTTGVTVDSSGNIYIADDNTNRIRKVTVDGIINTVAGNGTQGFSGDGNSATAARISYPHGMALDSSGNLYIADQNNHRVRKITPAGIISTVAGYGTQGYSGDGGQAIMAQLNNPGHVIVDSSGNLIITDGLNSRVRKVTPDGIITTIAGTGTAGFSGDGGLATSAQIRWIEGIALDSSGNLYLADYANNRVRKINTSGIISTVAGSGSQGYGGDGGPATSAPLHFPAGLAVDSAGNLYIADAYNNVVRKVTAAGIISTFAGNGLSQYSGDGGPAILAGLSGAAPANQPKMGLALDSANNLFIGDSGNHSVRKVTPDGIISTVAGIGVMGFSGDGGVATAAQMYYPQDIAFLPTGDMLIADGGNFRVRKVASILNCSSLSVSAGGVASCRTAGTNSATQGGYAKLTVNSGSAPYGTAVFSFKQSGVTVTEAGVPSSPPTTLARIFIDYRTGVTAIPGRSESGAIDINTGLSVVNLGSATANVSYTLRTLGGYTLANGQGTITKGNHIACFINQLQQVAGTTFSLPPGFERNTQFGTLEISSDQPLSIVALRMTSNQRGDVLYTTTPVADMTQALTSTPIFFPQFADGGGYTTSLALLNTSSQTETGSLQILDSTGNPLLVNQFGGSPNSTFQYSIPAGGAYRFQSDGLPATANVGWVRIIPDTSSMTPVGSGIFGYNPTNILVSESGIPSSVSTTHARVYVDLSGGHNVGLAIANIGSTSASITVNAYQTDGASGAGTSWGALPLVPYGQTAKFADQLIEKLPTGYRGVLEISSATPFAALTIRSLNNERSDFLMTAFPIADTDQTAPTPVVFPHLADGGGYVTEFILISGGAAANTTPGFYNDAGAPTDFSH